MRQGTFPAGIPRFGRLCFAVAIAASGLQQILSAKFVRLVPALPAWVPWHPSWARLVGVVLLVAGVAIALDRLGRRAALVLGALILLAFPFVHLPRVAASPLVGFVWTNPLKALALGGGAILVAAALPAREAGPPSAADRTIAKLVPLSVVLLAVFLVVCGIQHFVYADFVAQLVPAWIPGRPFWTYATGVALVSGGVGIVVPQTSRTAALLTGIMILLWVVLLHIPRALADLQNAGETSGVFEALAFSGVAFVLAGRFRQKQR